jgi:hypothetical protein
MEYTRAGMERAMKVQEVILRPILFVGQAFMGTPRWGAAGISLLSGKSSIPDR